MDGLWRMAVDYLSLPMTHVAFHDPKTGFRIVASSVKGANGITAQKPGNKIFVSALTGGVLTPQYKVDRLGNASIRTQCHGRLEIPSKN